MRALRWLFVLFLPVALDAAPPFAPSATEAFEIMEEEGQPARQRRGLRRTATTGAASVPRESLARMVQRPQTAHPAPVAPTAPAGRVRKLPPSTSDSASAPEDQ
jgi:hypothetical protein